jgi:hypothetical protein
VMVAATAAGLVAAGIESAAKISRVP